MGSITPTNSSLLNVENDYATASVTARKQVPRFLAVIFCLLVSVLMSYLLSLLITPALANTIFPDAGLEIILALQFIFFTLITFFSILFFILIYKIRIAGIFTLQKEELPPLAERNATLMGLLGLVVGGILGITFGYKVVAFALFLISLPLSLIGTKLYGTEIFLISYQAVVVLSSFLGWKIGKMVWHKQYSQLGKFISQFFRFNIPLLVSGILFLIIFTLGIIYKSEGTSLLLIPVGIIAFSFVLKIFNLKLAEFIVNLILLILSFVIADIFNSLCEIYVCYVEELMYLTPQVLLVGSLFGIYEKLPGFKLENSSFSKLIGIIIKIFITIGIAFLVLFLYNLIVPFVGFSWLGSSFNSP